jgi:hypothetical protein
MDEESVSRRLSFEAAADGDASSVTLAQRLEAEQSAVSSGSSPYDAAEQGDAPAVDGTWDTPRTRHRKHHRAQKKRAPPTPAARVPAPYGAAAAGSAHSAAAAAAVIGSPARRAPQPRGIRPTPRHRFSQPAELKIPANVAVEIFNEGPKGRGVRAVHAIDDDVRLFRYEGQRLTDGEFRRRYPHGLTLATYKVIDCEGGRGGTGSFLDANPPAYKDSFPSLINHAEGDAANCLFVPEGNNVWVVTRCRVARHEPLSVDYGSHFGSLLRAATAPPADAVASYNAVTAIGARIRAIKESAGADARPIIMAALEQSTAPPDLIFSAKAAAAARRSAVTAGGSPARAERLASVATSVPSADSNRLATATLTLSLRPAPLADGSDRPMNPNDKYNYLQLVCGFGWRGGKNQDSGAAWRYFIDRLRDGNQALAAGLSAVRALDPSSVRTTWQPATAFRAERLPLDNDARRRVLCQETLTVKAKVLAAPSAFPALTTALRTALTHSSFPVTVMSLTIDASRSVTALCQFSALPEHLELARELMAAGVPHGAWKATPPSRQWIDDRRSAPYTYEPEFTLQAEYIPLLGRPPLLAYRPAIRVVQAPWCRWCGGDSDDSRSHRPCADCKASGLADYGELCLRCHGRHPEADGGTCRLPRPQVKECVLCPGAHASDRCPRRQALRWEPVRAQPPSPSASPAASPAKATGTSAPAPTAAAHGRRWEQPRFSPAQRAVKPPVMERARVPPPPPAPAPAPNPVIRSGSARQQRSAPPSSSPQVADEVSALRAAMAAQSAASTAQATVLAQLSSAFRAQTEMLAAILARLGPAAVPPPAASAAATQSATEAAPTPAASSSTASAAPHDAPLFGAAIAARRGGGGGRGGRGSGRGKTQPSIPQWARPFFAPVSSSSGSADASSDAESAVYDFASQSPPTSDGSPSTMDLAMDSPADARGSAPDDQ